MISYRQALPSDVDFVVDSWLKSFRVSYSAGLIGMEVWRDVMDRQLRRILSRPGVDIMVAVNPEADSGSRLDVHGWIAFEHDFDMPKHFRERGKWVDRLVKSDDPLVHYVYVKNAYRLQGIARGLFKAAKIDPARTFYYTCRTPSVSRVSRHIPGGEWNPLISRFPKNKPEEQRDHETNPS